MATSKPTFRVLGAFLASRPSPFGDVTGPFVQRMYAPPVGHASNLFRTVTEVGIEPTDESPGSQPGRFSRLRTRPTQVAGQGLEPSCEDYEPSPSTRPPARSSVADPGIEPGRRPYESQLDTRPPAKRQ